MPVTVTLDKAKTYYAVWVLIGTDGDSLGEWRHHQSLDNMTDARDEARYCRESLNEVVEIRKQEW